ncbi:MAG: transposase [Sandaracinaceae bacterium]|nr:transposase [Sandaracinaceae bacterium]
MSAAVQTCTARADGYVRREPEATVLYRVVREHWPRFLERAQEQGGLPRFVVRDFEEYLRCGVLEHGVVQLACSRCGHSMVVAFSCKRRGWCPSCLGRRMADLAAHLVDDVLPEVPLRQWVCSLPWAMRCMLAFDRALCADVLAVFIAALTRSMRRRAKRILSLRSVDDALVGALTVIQRSDSALRVNPHFHTLALDGVYVRDAEGELIFHPLPAPSAEEVAQVAAWTHAGIVRVLERHGRSLDGQGDTPHEGASEEPVLAACYAASASDMQLLGAAPGQRTAKLVRPVRVLPAANEPLAEVGGVNVHANVAAGARDHPRRERLCRYLLRPPLAQDRLTLEPDGRVRLAFKAAWKDGTHAVLLDPLDLIARLCALVPPPRFHLLRYHGVLAAHSAVRAQIVPGREPPSPPAQLPLFEASEAPLAPPPPPSRHPWAWLLRRVFAVEVSICPVPTCGGRMRIVDIATTPDGVERLLGGEPTRARAPPPPAVSPAQLRLVFA